MENGDARVKDMKCKMRWPNVHLIESCKAEKRKWAAKVVLKETTSDHFLGIMKDGSPQIQRSKKSKENNFLITF